MVNEKRAGVAEGKKSLRGISLVFKKVKTLLTVDKTRSLDTPSPPLYTTALASRFKTYKLIKYFHVKSLGPFDAINLLLALLTALNCYMSTLRLVL